MTHVGSSMYFDFKTGTQTPKRKVPSLKTTVYHYNFYTVFNAIKNTED